MSSCSFFVQKTLLDGWMDGWVGGWMDGGESRVKDCLQQSKIKFGYFKKWEKSHIKITKFEVKI